MTSIKCILLPIAFTCFITISINAQQRTGRHKSIISNRQIILSYKDTTDSPKYTLRHDTVTLPVVDNNYPALKNALSIDSLLGTNETDLKTSYASCGCGTVGASFKVTYEDKGILSIQLTYESEAAYPSESQDWRTLNINTGKRYPISAEVSEKGRAWLLTAYKDTLLRRIKADKQTRGADEDTSTYNQLKDNISQLTAETLFSKYVFTNQGIVLSIDPILPHVVQALEPDDDVFISYAKLKPYLAPGSIIVKSAK